MPLGEKFTDIEILDINFPICNQCVHHIKNTSSCLAYPEGIPFQILQNLVDHKKPFPGDNGIRFKKIKK